MRKKVVIAMCLAVTIASLLRLTLFYLVTAVLAESYIEITRESFTKTL
jgi:hypothetical protein